MPDILKKNQQIPVTVCWKRNVYGFVDPIQALEYFQNYSDHIKLVLSDIRMQKMNGIEFVKKLRLFGQKLCQERPVNVQQKNEKKDKLKRNMQDGCS